MKKNETEPSRIKKGLWTAVLMACMSGCAVPGPSFLQIAKTLEPGHFRLGTGIGTGLHLEETAYKRLDQSRVQKGGDPNQVQAYQRDFAVSPSPLGLFGWCGQSRRRHPWVRIIDAIHLEYQGRVRFGESLARIHDPRPDDLYLQPIDFLLLHQYYQGLTARIVGQAGILAGGFGGAAHGRFGKHFLGPEISLSALDLTGKPIVHLNYGFGTGMEFG